MVLAIARAAKRVRSRAPLVALSFVSAGIPKQTQGLRGELGFINSKEVKNKQNLPLPSSHAADVQKKDHCFEGQSHDCSRKYPCHEDDPDSQ